MTLRAAKLFASAALVLTLGVWSCVRGNKGVEANKDQSQRQDSYTQTGIAGDGNSVWNVTLQGQSAGWLVASLTAAGWMVRARRDRLNEAALQRTVEGIESCGPDCDGKKYCAAHLDRVEKVIRKKAQKFPKQRVAVDDRAAQRRFGG